MLKVAYCSSELAQSTAETREERERPLELETIVTERAELQSFRIRATE